MKFNKKYFIYLPAILIAVLLCSYSVIIFCAKSNRPNIIFISLDALRADHLSCYGYKRKTSPNIDSLAARGTLFNQAISQSTWTTASLASILTSLYPNHEITEAGYSLSSKEDNLIKLLKSEGYTTALFSDAGPILNITFSGIKDTFDVFNISQVAADKVIESADRWLKMGHQKPFFLWIHLFDTHYPYTAPRSYISEFLSDNLYPHKNVPIAPDDGIKNEHYSFGVIPRHIAENGITDTAYYIAKYDAGIRFSDEQIGKLLQTLQNRRLKDNTLIILFSDHGESMTEHGLYFNHSHFVYEDLIRVPLVIVFPGKIPKKIIEQQVQLINIAPTVMELLGIKENNYMEGRSLLLLIRGKVEQLDLYAFSETAYKPSPRCIRTENWKLIHNRNGQPINGAYKLFNLKDDPKELRNLIKEQPQISAFLKEQLGKWSQTAKTSLLEINNFSKEDKEKIKSLGYIQ